jgi:hypothetical protein
MQWVQVNKKIQGIAYLPAIPNLKTGFIKLESPTQNFFNYAIPVKTNAKGGYCNYLKSHIKATKPLHMHLSKHKNATPYSNRYRGFRYKNWTHRVSLLDIHHDRVLSIVQLGNHKPFHYEKSIFMEIENKLINRKVQNI